MEGIEELAEGVWALGTRLFNQYLVRGARATALVEAGVSATSDRVAAQLNLLGIAPDWIVVTHPHSDHLTGLPALQKRFPGAQVVLGAGAREFAEHPKAARSLVAEEAFSHGQLLQRGLQVDGPPLTHSPDLSGCEILGEGDGLDLGGVSLRILETGGHAPGNLTVFCPERRAVFVSDSTGFRYSDGTLLPLFFSSLAAHRQTLDRLGGLGAKIAGPGHLGPVVGEGVGKLIAQVRRSTDSLVAQVRAGGDDVESLAHALFKAYYRDELSIYSPDNIGACISLLIRRSLEGL